MADLLNEPHPLFLPDEDDDAPLVSEIQISRMENGQAVFAPRVRPAAELQSLEQIAGEFGGGVYVLVARHEHRITTRRKYSIPGKPKPMYDEGPSGEKETHTPPPAAIDPMMAMMGMGGQGGGLMPILMMMFQQQNAAADRQTQMFIAMMNGNKDSSAQEKADARAELNASVERERINSQAQMTMFREMMMLNAQKSGGGSGEEFTRGVEFMRGFANQQIETMRAVAQGDGNSELGSILETLGQAFQAAQAVGMFKGGGTLPEGVPAVDPSAIPVQ